MWLNLSDGSILCGRRFFDGSGGNNHAVEHYSVSNYPLAVKLGTFMLYLQTIKLINIFICSGTITKEGKADVFSYSEDDMVEDPLLAQHLQHWGEFLCVPLTSQDLARVITP